MDGFDILLKGCYNWEIGKSTVQTESKICTLLGLEKKSCFGDKCDLIAQDNLFS